MLDRGLQSQGAFWWSGPCPGQNPHPLGGGLPVPGSVTAGQDGAGLRCLGTPGSSHTQQQQWGRQEELQGAAGLLSLGMCQLPLAAPAQTSSEGTDGTCFTDLAPGREGLGARLPANPAGNSTAPLGSLLGLPAWGTLQSASWDWTDDPAMSHAAQGTLPTSAGPV